MQSLFNEQFVLTAVGRRLEEETQTALYLIFKSWIQAGYSPREISHIMQNTVQVLECEHVLRIGVNEYQFQKAQREQALKSFELRKQIVDFLAQGKIIYAIKLVREKTNLSLKEAKEHVETVGIAEGYYRPGLNGEYRWKKQY